MRGQVPQTRAVERRPPGARCSLVDQRSRSYVGACERGGAGSDLDGSGPRRLRGRRSSPGSVVASAVEPQPVSGRTPGWGVPSMLGPLRSRPGRGLRAGAARSVRRRRSPGPPRSAASGARARLSRETHTWPFTRTVARGGAGTSPAPVAAVVRFGRARTVQERCEVPSGDRDAEAASAALRARCQSGATELGADSSRPVLRVDVVAACEACLAVQALQPARGFAACARRRPTRLASSWCETDRRLCLKSPVVRGACARAGCLAAACWASAPLAGPFRLLAPSQVGSTRTDKPCPRLAISGDSKAGRFGGDAETSNAPCHRVPRRQGARRLSRWPPALFGGAPLSAPSSKTSPKIGCASDGVKSTLRELPARGQPRLQECLPRLADVS